MFLFLTLVILKYIFSWQNDPLCNGEPYPKVYREIKRTLYDYRGSRFGSSPTNGTEILESFENHELYEEIAYSKLKNENEEKIQFFNDVIITDQFENCVFSSNACVSMIKEYVEVKERFFIVDGTFRITPKGVWQQVLILHVNFGMKVILMQNFTYNFFVKEKQITRSRIV